MRNDIEWITDEKPTSLVQIKKFEEKIGYKLPKKYIEFVLKFNGARVFNYITSFEIYYQDGEKYQNVFGVGAFLEFSSGLVPNESSLMERYCIKNNFIKYLVPFIEDGGGNLVCFDYRHDPKTENPRVVFWFHEGTGENNDEIFFIANSFEEFIDCLFDDRTEDEKIKDARIRREYIEKYGNSK